MRNTKSDWFALLGLDGKVYALEIFGVNKKKGTKHCMRLMFGGKELEVFHLEDFKAVCHKYLIHSMFYEPKEFENCGPFDPTVGILLYYSKQLKEERELSEATKNTQMLYRRLHQ